MIENNPFWFGITDESFTSIWFKLQSTSNNVDSGISYITKFANSCGILFSGSLIVLVGKINLSIYF